MFVKKLRSEVIQDILNRLEETTPIFNAEPGSVVRTLVEIISEVFGQVYRELDFLTAMSFVSTAKNNYLDLIGELMNCKRTMGETDDAYRYRIVNQVYVVAGANETAVRLKALSVPGVRDVIMKQFIRGTGSFGVYVISDDAVTPPSMLNQVQDVLEQAKAYGIYAEARSPVLIPVDLMVSLVFEEGTSPAKQVIDRENAKNALQEYMDNIPLGGQFILAEAANMLFASSTSVIDLNIYEMKVYGVRRFVSNLQASEGERIYLKSVDII